MRILYRFATRSRPERFFKCLDNMFAMMHHDDFTISITADTDDSTMFNDVVKDKIFSYKNTVLWYGTSESKIYAINRDTGFTKDWDILINMSDDMEFIQPGFDTLILQDYSKFAVGDVLMHYPDQAAGAALITMAIMDRKYYDRFGYYRKDGVLKTFMMDETERIWEGSKWVELPKDVVPIRGYIYNPEYKSLFCDNEQQEVAKLLGRYVFIKRRLFNHNHPAWGLAPVDALMVHTESFHKVDKETFERRKLINFGV